MSAQIILDCSESTMRSPIAFFTSFIKKRKIINAIDQFQKNVPDPPTVDDDWSSNCSYISDDKMEYHLEHTLENYVDPLDISTYKSSQITEVVSFEREIEKAFRKEYVISKQLLRRKFSESTMGYGKKKDLLANVRDLLKEKIFPCIDLIKSDSLYKQYEDLCLRPFYAIIRLIYREFSDFAPLYSFDSRIAPIIKGASDSDDLYIPQALDLTVVDALLDFQLVSAKKLITVENISITSNNLKLILGSTDIVPPSCSVWLKGQIGPINYMLGLLLERVDISRPTLERWNCVKIERNKFFANECNREFSRYPFLNPDDAARIRHLINSYLV